MKDIIIIGGSKFVCEVDLPRIDTERFDVLAINRQPLNITTKYLIAHDSDFRPAYSQEEVVDIKKQGGNPVFIAPKTEFIHETTGWSWKPDIISNQDKILGFCLYTCSSALNFAYLRGYKNVYFIGVDLEENNKPFSHWHGVTNKREVSANSARQAKEYLYRYKKLLNMYQCNPNVSKNWDIPYCRIERLYKQQKELIKI